MHCLVGAPLWHHHYASNLLDLGVIWGTHTVQVASNLDTHILSYCHSTASLLVTYLSTQVRYGNELFEDILW